MEKINEYDMDRLGKIKCETCGKRDDVKRCAKCTVIGYCGAACQTSNWKEHKKICAQLVAMRETGGRA
jgi:hypothetical protein